MTDVRKVLEPFAALAAPWMKGGEHDDSVWTKVLDDTKLQVGAAAFGWNHITVGDLRRAAEALSTLTNEQVGEEEIAAVICEWRAQAVAAFGSCPNGINDADRSLARAILSRLPLRSGMKEGVIRDARRYRRLQILGCAVMDTRQLAEGSVSRFSHLDKIVDDDLKARPSRGEADPHLPSTPSDQKKG